MRSPVGVHKGKLVEELVIKEPAYVHWLLGQSPTGGLLGMKIEAKNLIKKFDGKPYTVKCFNRCGNPVARLSVYGDSIVPMWWCTNCDPYDQGANDGKLQIFSHYVDALDHVQMYCDGKKGDYRSLIKSMAKAKGLPARVGEPQLEAFFE